MRFCSACGRQLSDTAAFCEGCGSQCGNAEGFPQFGAAAPQAVGKKTLHCPECKGKSIAPIVESTNTGGYAVNTRLTRRVGVTSYSSNTTHRNYWLCQSCGAKFRNLQNLNAELANMEKSAKYCLICAIVTAVLAFLFLIGAPSILCLFGIFPLFAALIFLIFWLIYRSNAKKLTEEKAYLERNCFI